MDYIYNCMMNLDSELKRARREMHTGSLDNAVSILDTLRAELERPAPTNELTEQERIEGLIKVLNNLGVVQKNRGAFEPAARLLERALEIAEHIEADAISMKVGILSNLGLLYSRQKQYKKSMDALNKALEMAEENPGKVSPKLVTKLRNNRALFHVRFGDPGKAREELALSIEPHNEIEPHQKDPEREAWLTANLAMIHAELGEDEFYNPPKQEELYCQARSMFLASAKLYGDHGYLHHRLKQLINAAEMELRLRAPSEARRHLLEAQREATMLKDACLLCEIAHLNVELALQLRKQKLITECVEDALKLLHKTNPEDLTSRLARLEGVLARSGCTEALQVVLGYKTARSLKKVNRQHTTHPYAN